MRSNGGGIGFTFFPDVVRVRVGLAAADVVVAVTGADVVVVAAAVMAAGGDDLTLRSSGVSCGSFMSS